MKGKVKNILKHEKMGDLGFMDTGVRRERLRKSGHKKMCCRSLIRVVFQKGSTIAFHASPAARNLAVCFIVFPVHSSL